MLYKELGLAKKIYVMNEPLLNDERISEHQFRQVIKSFALDH